MVRIYPRKYLFVTPKYLFLTNQFTSARLSLMSNPCKKLAGFLLIPFLLAITLCCCVDEQAHADETHGTVSVEHPQDAHELEKTDHSEHQHSDGDHECTCPKHLSFLSEQSVDIVFNSSFSQMLAKSFLANLRFENIVLFASLSNHSQGPPPLDHRDYVSLPIYLKVSNLRI